jgi:protein O-GlcNAc transferase
VCYSARWLEDEYTARYRSAAHLWRTTARLTNEEMAELVRADEIDILFDLMGHSGQRLALFDRRSAPMQITWLGYAGTTGVSAMDYLLADQFHVRDGEEGWYTETVIRMPHGYACYSPPDYAPDVRSLPALSTGHITFGCFNNPAKYSPRTIDNWAQILRAQPKSRLLLKFHGLDQPNVQQRLRGIFSQRGIDSERLTIEGSSPHADLLAAYNRVDIALDTQPYSGGLTTCEALWMGVPVITCPGPTFAGRHSTSHLTNAGYSQFVAQNTQGYIELAVQWANQLDELASLRSQMRAQVRQSPLCDAPRFARDFLAILSEARETFSRNNGVQKRTI